MSALSQSFSHRDFLPHEDGFLSIEDDLGCQFLEARQEAAKNFAPKNANSSKAGRALFLEIENFIRVYGQDHCGLLTLVFTAPNGVRHISPADAQAVFKKAARRFLSRLFAAYIAVLDFHRSGAVHLHLVVATKENIGDGWDFELDCQHRDLRAGAKQECRKLTSDELVLARSLARRLTTNPVLKQLWKILRIGLPKYGFPKRYPFELKPVRDPGGLAHYLAGRYRESRASKHRPAHALCKRFSKSYQRCVAEGNRFSNVGANATLYRRKKAAVGAAFGIHDIEAMSDRFGCRWEFDFREVLFPINPYHPLGFFSDQSAKLRLWAATAEQASSIVSPASRTSPSSASTPEPHE